MSKSYLLSYVGYLLLSYFIFFLLLAFLPIDFPQLLILALVPSLFTSHFLALRKEKKLEIQIRYGKDEFNPYLYGFGGWLYLLAFQMIINFIQQVSNIFTILDLINSGVYNEMYNQNKLFGTYLLSSFSGTIILIVLIILTGLNAIKQKKIFIRYAIIYQATVLLFTILRYILEINLDIEYNVITIYITLVMFWVWSAYLLKSKRVKQTFIK